MNSIKFVTENPFRLLGLGSNISYSQLVKKAEAASRAQKVGLAMPVACDSAFGSEELVHCVEIVRSLVNDPKTQTLYRVFWPAQYNIGGETDGSVDELRKLADAGEGDGKFPAQARFLLDWVTFENQPSVESLKAALASFKALSDNTEFDSFLAGILQDEDGDESARQVIVHETKRLVVGHMFGRACTQSAALLKAGEIDAGIAILDAVCASDFDRDLIDKALIDHMAPFGDREMEALKTVIEASNESEEVVGYNPHEFALLSRLAEALKGSVPATALWVMTIDERISQAIEPIRERAINAANEREDFEEARRILLSARELPLPHSVELRIEDDLRKLQEVVESKTLWEGITPIQNAPSLFTINGFGVRLYGRQPFAGNPAWYFATHYIVFVFIPVFPIGRYLVSDAQGGGWHFYGKAPLNKGNHIHMALSALVLLCMFVAGSLNSSNPGSDSYPPPTSYSAMTGQDSSGGPETFQDRRARLRSEFDTLVTSLENDKAQITTDDAILDNLNKDLDKELSAIHTQEKKLNKADKDAVAILKVRKQQYAKDRDSYNSRVDKQNELVTAAKKRAVRAVEVQKALHDMGD